MPGRFTFRLQPLLRLRQRREEQRKGALAAAMGKLNEQTQRIRRYDGLIRGEHHSLRQDHLVGPLDIRRLAHHRRYVNTLMRSMIETLTEREGTARQAEQARAELAEAARQRQVLEKLRDRRRDEWDRQADRAETQVLDEAGLQGHRRAVGGDDRP